MEPLSHTVDHEFLNSRLKLIAVVISTVGIVLSVNISLTMPYRMRGTINSLRPKFAMEVRKLLRFDSESSKAKQSGKKITSDWQLDLSVS